MFILITGVPGTGKTTISKTLKKVLNNKYVILNDKEFCKKNDLGKYTKQNEYVVSIPKLNSAFKKFCLQNSYKNIICEGHLWCELNKQNLKLFDFVFELRASPKDIRKRLNERRYPVTKIEDNVFCQETNYVSNNLDLKDVVFYKVNVNNDINKNINKIKKIIYGKNTERKKF